MRTLEQQLQYEQLELVAQPSSMSSGLFKKAMYTVQTTIQAVWQATLHGLTQGHELRIWTSEVKSGLTRGQKIWHLYDPSTQRKTSFSSEEEVRYWLETRYYR